MTKPVRLEGLDLARFIAFVGMVMVNFKIAMGAQDDESLLADLSSLLEGRAAATFVTLAGVGLGLSALRKSLSQTLPTIFKRAFFLLVLGLLNMQIFDADILHYYAFYFFFGALLLPLDQKGTLALIFGINLAFLGMIFAFDYSQGWDFENFTYAGFWTPEGFFRNLFFNGWHPVIPWLSFLLYGIWLGRLPYLSTRQTQYKLLASGTVMVVLAEGTSTFLSPILAGIHPELADLSATSPVPPGPLYILAGCGVASVLISLCLLVEDWLKDRDLLGWFTPAGRQTLTLYIAHILLGMGTMEAMDLLGGQSISSALIASAIFCALSALYAVWWNRTFQRGPLEMLMRKIAG